MAASLAMAAPPAGAVDVADEAALRAAFADSDETLIVLTNDIVLDDCTEAGGDLDRDAAVLLSVNGNTHTIEQTCPGERVMEDVGAGGLSLTNLRLTGTGAPVVGDGGAVRAIGRISASSLTVSGHTATGNGGAIWSANDVELQSTTLQGNSGAGSGAVFAGNFVFVADSTLSGNAATGPDGVGGAIRAEVLGIRVVNSTVSANTASGFAGGGALSTPGHVSTDSSAFVGNSTNGADGNGGAVDAGSVSVTGGTVFTGNRAGDQGDGGAISSDGAVDVAQGRFEENDAVFNGGAIVASAVTVTLATFIGNRSSSGSGGAIASESVSIADSTFSGNTVSAEGGAIWSVEGVEAVSSTFSGNAAGIGGAIAALGQTSVTNSTVTSNTATRTGAGIVGSAVSLVHATVVGNSAPAAVNVLVRGDTPGPHVLSVFGSVLAQPEGDGGNCQVVEGTTVDSGGYNFSDDDTCGLQEPTDTQDGGDPMLGPLADNGGPTQTRLPLLGSPLLDAIPPGEDCPRVEFDQRGIARPNGPGCDIGAVDSLGNQTPVADDQALTGPEDASVAGTAGATDPDGDSLDFSVSTDPADGEVEMAANGTFTYTPDENFNGADSFVFSACDPLDACDTATVTITVLPVNDAPSAVGDTVTVVAGQTAAFSPLANDTDAEGDALTAVIVTQPAHGTLACTPAGACTYTPAAAFVGTDTFSYAADDGAPEPDCTPEDPCVIPAAASASATVTITVTPAPAVPTQPAPSTTATTATTVAAEALPVTGGETITLAWLAFYVLTAGAAVLLADAATRRRRSEPH